MRSISVVATLLLSVYVGAGTQSSEQSKPVRERPIHLDNLPEPAYTLGELWDRADVVIEGTVLAVTPADLQLSDSEPPRTLVFTDYDIAIAEVFKADSRIRKNSTIVRIKRRGGTRDRGDYVERTSQEGFPEFKQGERYILFLSYLTREFYAVESPDSAFLLTTQGIKARGKSSLADVIAASPDFTLRTLLRRQGGAR
jgi:hypothetical protein